MIDLVAQQIVGKSKYVRNSRAIEYCASDLITQYSIYTGLRQMNTQGTYTTMNEKYVLDHSRIQLILNDPTQLALLTDKCVELLLMNSLQEIL